MKTISKMSWTSKLVSPPRTVIVIQYHLSRPTMIKLIEEHANTSL